MNRGRDPVWVRVTLTALAFGALGLFILLPLIAVFVQAFEKGWEAYRSVMVQPEAVSAIELSLLEVAIAVVLNTVFGVAAAWALHAEILYNEYNYAGAFAVVSVLSIVAVIALALKKLLEWKTRQEMAQ